MGLESFLGNEVLKQRLTAAIEKDELAHSYLISGPAGSGKHTLVKLLAAAMECTGQGKPCLRCPQCRKVMEDIHPDLITVDDDEHKTIPVSLVRSTCSDLYIRPNEGRKKIYIFPRAQDLNDQGQNALLKCIEEPPAYGVFILVAERADELLLTIRSRCTHLQTTPLSDEVMLPALQKRFPEAAEKNLQKAVRRSGGYLGQACELLQEGTELLPQTQTFIDAYCRRNKGDLLRLLAPMEEFKRDRLLKVLEQWQEVLTSALICCRGVRPMYEEAEQIAGARAAGDIMQAINGIRESIELLEANVGTGHVCGALLILLQ